MPHGLYVLSDPESGEPLVRERFSCAPGPLGWRYVGARTDAATDRPIGGLDLTLDQTGRQLRVEVRAGRWTLRGGVVGDRCVWTRFAADGGSAAAESPSADGTDEAVGAAGLLGDSPGFLVALSRLPPGALRLVLVAGAALGTRTIGVRWQLAETVSYDTDLGPLDVVTWHLDDLDTGIRQVLHLAGDVVLDAPGLELEELDSPPNRIA